MKLYKIEVKLQGFYYVAANHPTEAQEKLMPYLDISEWDIISITYFEEANKGTPAFNHQYRYLP